MERFNTTLADRLFSYQYHKELEDPSKSNREWVSRLQNVVSALNNEKTRLIGMKPVDAIKQTLVKQGFSQPVKDYQEKLLDVGTKVRCLYESCELEGQIYKGERRKRSTDPIWSIDLYKIKDMFKGINQRCTIYMVGLNDLSFPKSYNPFRILSYQFPYSLQLILFERVFSGGMYLAYSIFPSIINIFFKTK